MGNLSSLLEGSDWQLDFAEFKSRNGKQIESLDRSMVLWLAQHSGKSKCFGKFLTTQTD